MAIAPSLRPAHVARLTRAALAMTSLVGACARDSDAQSPSSPPAAAARSHSAVPASDVSAMSASVTAQATVAAPAAAATAAAAAAAAAAPLPVSYADVAPIFKRSCLRCHDARKRKGDLRLDNRADAMKGGESGVVIVPGDAAGSLLVKSIKLPEDHEDHMPAKGDPLTTEEIALIERWIDQGAPWPET